MLLFSESGIQESCYSREGHDKIIDICKKWLLFLLWAVISVFAAYHTINMTVSQAGTG